MVILCIETFFENMAKNAIKKYNTYRSKQKFLFLIENIILFKNCINIFN